MSDTPSMVERMARAMQRSKAWPAVFEAGTARELARAALRELREPSTAMVDSGVAFALNVSIGGGYRWTDYIRDMQRGMADAALAEEEKAT